MSTGDFLRNLAVIGSWMAVLALAELALPLRSTAGTKRGRVGVNLTLTALVFVMTWALMQAASALLPALSAPAFGVAELPWPFAAKLLLGVAALDLFTYVAHWSMHKLPWLWRFHRVHHSDPLVDVTTSFRLHPLEGLWRYLWVLVPAVALGLPLQIALLYRLVSAVNGALEHANFALWQPLDRLLSWVWVTPNMHKIHHSAAAAQADTNYGNILSLYDRGFGTFTPTRHAAEVTYGLGVAEPAGQASLKRLLALPFAGGVQSK